MPCGENGILKGAEYATDKYQNKAEQEQNEIDKLGSIMDGYINGVRNEEQNDFFITTTYVGTSEMTVKVDTSKISEEIKKYVYIVGEKIKESENAEETITELEADTNYDITVVAITNQNKHLKGTITRKTEKRTYLYKNGDQCVALTGGWKAEAILDTINTGAVAVVPTLTFNSDNMQLYCLASSGQQGGSLLINNKIDYSSYKKICIEYTATLGRYNSASAVDFVKNKQQQAFTGYIYGPHACYEQPITTKTVAKCDIDNVNDFGIYIQSDKSNGAVNCNIYNVWLEK